MVHLIYRKSVCRFTKALGGKLAPKLVYFVLKKELLNVSVIATRPQCLINMFS